MKKWLVAVATALLMGCSQGGPGEQDSRPSESVFEAPDVAPTAAPSVAFRYFYTFELPDEGISAVQEKHASRCEAMGAVRCRITGLGYSVHENDAVSASLTVKLAPDISRQFGKDAAADVKEAHGRLRSTEFRGEDTEPATTAATRQQSGIQTRVADIERQLASARTGEERAQLQLQLDQLRSQLSQAQATIAATQSQLASTPMTFNYYGRGGISGFRTNPVWEAMHLFVSSLVTMISVVLQVLAVLLPWAILLFLLYLIATSRIGHVIRRFFGRRSGYTNQQ